MEVRTTVAPDEVAQAMALDAALMGAASRVDHIASVAAAGGLRVAVLNGEIRGFSCLDHDTFFAKPFVTLLCVAPTARRHGLGTGLLAQCAHAFDPVWTSTNRSNTAMRALLAKAQWAYRGQVSGLDDGDPEMFFTSPPASRGARRSGGSGPGA